MIKLQLFFGIVTFALWVYSLIDVINTREEDTKHIAKLWWLLLVLFFPLVGSIAWLVAGRDRGAGSSGYALGGRGGRAAPTSAFPEYDRPGRARASDDRADDEFLRQVRERAEQQRREYAERKRAEAAAAEAEKQAKRAER